MGFSLTLVCPLTIKKSIGLQRGKNDRIDAKKIANYAALHYRKLELYKLPDEDLVRLRGWIIVRDNLVKQKVSSIKLLERSEEHTSELQSRQYLVCRLLLEKKKNIKIH